MIDNLREKLSNLRLTVWKQTNLNGQANLDHDSVGEVLALIQAHTNAEIAKVLDRLEAELNEQKKAAETNLAYHVDVTKSGLYVIGKARNVHGIEFCRPAIAAERAKLKEVK